MGKGKQKGVEKDKEVSDPAKSLDFDGFFLAS